MNIMNRLAWRSLWKNRPRTIATIIGIILSAAMFTAVTTLGVSLLQYMIGVIVYNSGDYFIRFDNATPEQVQAIEAREEISQLGTAKIVGYANVGTEESSNSYILSVLDENAFAMRSIHLESGRLPENADEIAVPEHSLWYLRAMGMAGELGEILTLDVVPRYEDEHYYEHMPEFPIGPLPDFSRSYTIVGIVENESSRLSDWSMEPMSFITVDDGSYPGFHWARCFAKTADPMDAHVLHDASLANVCSVNTNLLNYYGASKYTNINETLYTICAVLMVIILAGSVSLIYNAFSISLAERSKDFGLLSSVGATRKQLRRSVYFEALCLSAIGVPLGILFGFGGIAVTLYLIGDLVAGLLAGSIQSGVEFTAVPSLPAFVCAGAVAVLTVLLSAWLPLRRAMKLDPIRAIRQNGDYQIPKRGIRGGTLAAKLFGVPGLMSAKYYGVSRRKYRTTVISLTISVVLFLTSVGFTQVLQSVAESNTNNYNFDISISAVEHFGTIRQREDVAQCAEVWKHQYQAFVEPATYTEEHRELVQLATYIPGDISTPSVNVFFLEDGVFRAFLEEQGIDPAPYFDTDTPTAICCMARVTVYTDLENGEYERTVHAARVFADSPVDIPLYAASYPEPLVDLLGETGGFDWEFTHWEGNLVQTFTFYDATVPQKYPANEDGTLSIVRIPAAANALDYYFFDLDTMTLGEYLFTEEDAEILPTVRVLDQVEARPFGIEEYSGATILSLVFPASTRFSPDANHSLNVKAADYDSLIDWLEANLEHYEYTDYLSSQMQYRNLVTMINVFAYGFIILISLICVCNVFNTISTNVALRRRDFGMLRSVGMQNRQLNRMLLLECARYGVKSLLLGLPIGLAIGYEIYVLLDIGSSVSYRLPWAALVAAVICVFIVVFITMFYAVQKLQRDDPIDAIRMDNL